MEKTNKPEIWDNYQLENRESYSTKSGYKDPTFYFINYLIKKKIIKTTSLLEIGYGDGKTLQLLSKKFDIADGADISSKNVEITKKEFSELNIKNSEIFVLDLAEELKCNKKYDIVMLSHVLEHFTKEELEVVVPNIYKLLNKGGMLVGAVPFNLQLTYRICPKCGEKFEIDGHRITYDLDNFRENFLKFGFKKIIIRSHNFEFYSRHDNFIKKVTRKLYYSLVKKPNTQIEFCLEKQ